MKPFNIFLVLGLAALVPLTASADRGSKYRSPRRCGNDRSYSSFNSNWNPYNPSRPHGLYPGAGTGGGYYQPRSWGYGGNLSGGSYGSGYRPGALKGDYLVQRGVQSGELSRAEVRDIREEQRDIREKEQRYYSDGRLSNREWNDLRGDYKDFDKDIRHNLNDGERSYRSR